MYTKQDLYRDLENMRIDPNGTLLIHSSMKSIGMVEGGADTVLDVLCDYMKNGLLIFPTHTWSAVNAEHPIMYAATDPCCVGLLPNMFLKREGVVRSLHPTHSVAAYGRDAKEYTSGEEFSVTPCSRQGCWGKLYDRHAAIMFLGCSTKSNTYIHGVEEWCDTPNRLTPYQEILYTVAPDGRKYTIPQYRHNDSHPSNHYDKMEPVFAREDAMYYGTFGSARCAIGDAVKMADITTKYLKQNYHLFDDDTPITQV